MEEQLARLPHEHVLFPLEHSYFLTVRECMVPGSYMRDGKCGSNFLLARGLDYDEDQQGLI